MYLFACEFVLINDVLKKNNVLPDNKSLSIMKKYIAILSIAIFFPFFVVAQCNNELIDLCQKENGGAKKMKEFPVRLKKVNKRQPAPYARYIVSLKKGNKYRFNVKNDSLNESEAFLMLSDDYKTYGSTFNPVDNNSINYFDFNCKSSGTYYITIQFMDKNGGCAVGMLSFVDNFNVYSSRD